MKKLEVYSRRGCHLCEQMTEELVPLVRGRAEVVVHDVDTREDWRAAYGNDVPVLVFRDQEICRHTLDREALAAVLAATA